MSTSTIAAGRRAAVTTKQKVGLVLCILYGVSNVLSVLQPTPDGDTGPPLSILVVDAVLGVVAVVGAVLAWRGNRVGLRIAAGVTILATVTALPAFFVDVPTWVKALVGFLVILTVVMVVLMFSDDRRRAPVVD